MNKLRELIKKAMIFMIKSYQLTMSPRFSGGACRYTPTCSQYTLEAIEIHGIFKGTLLGIRRIARCNPFFKGGFDPVPLKKENKHNEEDK